jgi:hypothetical protein
LFNGMPCGGLATRGEAMGELPALPALVGAKKFVIRSRVPGDLVPAIDRSRPDGALVLDRLIPGAPGQMG